MKRERRDRAVRKLSASELIPNTPMTLPPEVETARSETEKLRAKNAMALRRFQLEVLYHSPIVVADPDPAYRQMAADVVRSLGFVDVKEIDHAEALYTTVQRELNYLHAVLLNLTWLGDFIPVAHAYRGRTVLIADNPQQKENVPISVHYDALITKSGTAVQDGIKGVLIPGES
jgi:hypothetical protein